LRPYVIPLGGSNGLGAAAYAAAFLELLDQFEGLRETLDAVIVPTVSGGTLAGLLLGRLCLDLKAGLSALVPAIKSKGQFDESADLSSRLQKF
jgi:1-aminocyclopropane-1-carboxylate deaminase/D-cysteine desulfhydrase-like pyridoxal-dependent ACC family enzyme